MIHFPSSFFSRFVGPGIGFGPRAFRSARVKLTVVYTLAIALVMAGFSVALYLAVSAGITSTLEVPESLSARTEHAVLEEHLARARIALLAVNSAGWVLAAGASYLIAGWTLRPIESAVSRQRQFTSHASHELRTPLTVMKGEIDVTAMRDRSPEEYRETLTRIDEEITQLDAITVDLLSLARLEADSRVRNRRSQNVRASLERAIQSVQADARARGLMLRLDVPADLEASLDWDKIDRLVSNLLTNAVQHASPAGTVLVRAAPDGSRRGRFELTVYNSGAPISPKDLPHLFMPFYRGAGSDPGSGTGLGLALVDWIVRCHHGSVSAQNVEGGVSFVVRLPLA
jgi:signal transduction histidine kinase